MLFNFLPKHSSILNFESQMYTEIAFDRETVDGKELGCGVLNMRLEFRFLLVLLQSSWE